MTALQSHLGNLVSNQNIILRYKPDFVRNTREWKKLSKALPNTITCFRTNAEDQLMSVQCTFFSNGIALKFTRISDVTEVTLALGQNLTFGRRDVSISDKEIEDIVFSIT